ncbi:MAG: nitroreductase family protein [Lachnospiraceae bacterium]|nr:nitroreductase family protein [Lachnospiraceae bacterium]
MSMREALKSRRSYYNIKKELPVAEEEVIRLVEDATELVPDAFNMKSSRVVIVMGEKQDQLWGKIYDLFGGKVPKEKIDGFRAGAGTLLYFYDASVVKGLQERFPAYADNFTVWANQASAMLQISVWAGLRELGVGASLQHYNPVIDGLVRELCGVPENYVLVAQMPFGGIVSEPAPKEKEDITKRVKVVRD